MLDIAVDKVAEVIILARDLDRTEAEFDAFIESLNEDEKANLVALMWIGRGTFEPEEWDEAVQTALTEATTPTADYLKGSPHLADHLENGLDALGISALEAEDDVY
jgi:light-regulated signal transduction histidine kinase (bacteriophytochrome)